MTNLQYRYWCELCTKKEQQKFKGIVCNLTGEKPSFAERCNDFDYDSKRDDYLKSKSNKQEEFYKRKEKADARDSDIFSRLIFGFPIALLLVVFKLSDNLDKNILLLIYAVILMLLLGINIISIKFIKSNERGVIIKEGEVIDVVSKETIFKFPFKQKVLKINLDLEIPEWKTKKDFEINREALIIAQNRMKV